MDKCVAKKVAKKNAKKKSLLQKDQDAITGCDETNTADSVEQLRLQKLVDPTMELRDNSETQTDPQPATPSSPAVNEIEQLEPQDPARGCDETNTADGAEQLEPPKLVNPTTEPGANSETQKDPQPITLSSPIVEEVEQPEPQKSIEPVTELGAISETQNDPQPITLSSPIVEKIEQPEPQKSIEPVTELRAISETQNDPQPITPSSPIVEKIEQPEPQKSIELVTEPRVNSETQTHPLQVTPSSPAVSKVEKLEPQASTKPVAILRVNSETQTDSEPVTPSSQAVSEIEQLVSKELTTPVTVPRRHRKSKAQQRVSTDDDESPLISNKKQGTIINQQTPDSPTTDISIEPFVSLECDVPEPRVVFNISGQSDTRSTSPTNKFDVQDTARIKEALKLNAIPMLNLAVAPMVPKLDYFCRFTGCNFKANYPTLVEHVASKHEDDLIVEIGEENELYCVAWVLLYNRPSNFEKAFYVLNKGLFYFSMKVNWLGNCSANLWVVNDAQQAKSYEYELKLTVLDRCWSFKGTAESCRPRTDSKIEPKAMNINYFHLRQLLIKSKFSFIVSMNIRRESDMKFLTKFAK